MTTADPSLPPTADRVARADDALARAGVRVARRRARRPTISRPSARAGRARRRGWSIAADAQTAGRGRLGRSWHSPPGENLYVLDAAAARRARRRDPAADAAGGRRGRARRSRRWASRRGSSGRTTCSWSTRAGRRRKLAGILTEMASAGDARRARRGRHRPQRQRDGVSRRARRPRDVAARWRSGSRSIARALLAAVLDAFEPLLRRLRAARARRRRSRRSTRYAALGARCRVPRRRRALEGVALGVDPDGALRLRDDAGADPPRDFRRGSAMTTFEAAGPGRRAGGDRVPAHLVDRAPAHRPGAGRLGRSGRRVHRRAAARARWSR